MAPFPFFIADLYDITHQIPRGSLVAAVSLGTSDIHRILSSGRRSG